MPLSFPGSVAQITLSFWTQVQTNLRDSPCPSGSKGGPLIDNLLVLMVAVVVVVIVVAVMVMVGEAVVVVGAVEAVLVVVAVVVVVVVVAVISKANFLNTTWRRLSSSVVCRLSSSLVV